MNGKPILRPNILPSRIDSIRFTVIVLLVVMSAGYAAAQGSVEPMQQLVQTDQRNGEIQLAVVDPQGAVIPKARVTLSDGPKVLVSQVTANDGSLRLPGLVDGSYLVEISFPGFETYKDNVIVKAGSITRLNVTLKVGQGGWSTGPTAEPPLVDTGEPVAPTQIDQQPVQPIPAAPKHTNLFKRFFKKLFHR